MKKIKRATFQHIESELSAYHDTRKEMTELINDILYGTSGGDENVGGGRSNIPGDPTARTATVLTSHRRLDQLQTITNAIETVYDKLPVEKRKFVQVRYWSRPRVLNWDGIAKECHVSRRQAIRWRDEVVYAVSLQLGWR